MNFSGRKDREKRGKIWVVPCTIESFHFAGQGIHVIAAEFQWSLKHPSNLSPEQSKLEFN
jgi:hypothetical protein